MPLASTAAVLSQCCTTHWDLFLHKCTHLDHCACVLRHGGVGRSFHSPVSSEVFLLVLPHRQGERVIIKRDSIHGYVGEAMHLLVTSWWELRSSYDICYSPSPKCVVCISTSFRELCNLNDVLVMSLSKQNIVIECCSWIMISTIVIIVVLPWLSGSWFVFFAARNNINHTFMVTFILMEKQSSKWWTRPWSLNRVVDYRLIFLTGKYWLIL